LEQRQLYRTLENAFKHLPEFEEDTQLLSFIINQIINHEEISITGGRLWSLNETKNTYRMVEQVGEIEKVKKKYELKLDQYPMFYEVGKNRSVLSKETDEYLSNLGIKQYSATGIGERYKVRSSNGTDEFLYQYILALNSSDLNASLLNTMNIISTTVTSMLRTRRVETKARIIEKELQKAKEIQQSILPEHEYIFSNYEIFGISIPDKLVGGDFFDYTSFGEDSERIGIAIGDAASKGFSAAAQALYVSGALKMGTENELKMTTVIKKINNLVFRTFPNERFVTLVYLELYSDKKGLCVYVNAGHNKPMLLRYYNDSFEMLDSTGAVLGPSPNQNYLTDSFYFNLYDVLLLYTDGIVEAVNNKFEFFGEERLKQLMLDNKHFPARVIAANVMEEIQKYSARGKYNDDKTIVVIKRIK
jgi:sigma-B regulation protein RsbU (phosphoserine phosphatase)